MRVFVTGGTGYVGRHVLRALLAAGHVPVTLVRLQSIGKLPVDLREKIEIVNGEVNASESYLTELGNCEAVINLSGIIREFPDRGITFYNAHVRCTEVLLEASKKAGIRRFLQMSALGARAGACTGYQRTKFDAEQLVQSAGLEWAIFRPSLIVGHEEEGCKNFITTLRDLLTMLPFVVPVLGSGESHFQPVAVDDVAAGFVRALTTPVAGKIYDVAGSERFSFNELLDLVGAGMGIKKLKIHQPLWIIKIMASLLGGFSFFPISRDQIIMLEEESVTDAWQPFFTDFDIVPIPVRTAIGA
jgi:NADH dehydrogenase